jgi:cytochrome c oxidase cbb3-type subunit 1
VLVMLWAGAKWLVLATVLGLLTSLKFHGPGLMADSAWLTYGRLQPVFWNLLLYGFALQSGWATGLWMLMRLGRTPVALSWAAITGACLWNIGLVVGVVGILAGHSTGHPWLEVPGYATPLLLLGCALVSLSLLATFRARRRLELEPTQWFLLAAIFVFPWVYSTAQILLVFAPVRGIMQAVVAWWFSAQLLWFCLAFLGLAILWEMIPRLAGRPLHSRYLALFAFWLLVLFTGWRGVPNSAPVPAWMPSVTTVFAVFSLVPLLAVAVNFHRTLAGRYREMAKDSVRVLALTSVLVYVVVASLGILQRLPSVSQITDLTFFEPGVRALFVYGFLGSALLAISYEIVPCLLPTAIPSRALGKFQVATWVLGVAIHAFPLILGGMAQGAAMNQPEREFMDSFRSALMALRLSTMGDLLLLLSATLYVFNFGRGWVVACRQCCEPWIASILRAEPVEASR